MPTFIARIIVETVYELTIEAPDANEAERKAQAAFYDNDSWQEDWRQVDRETEWDGVALISTAARE